MFIKKICVIIPGVKANIRFPSKNDLQAIVEIENRSFSVPWGREFFEGRLNSLLIADIKDRVVAYILFDKAADEVHIIRIAVHPEFRRQGIAKSLVNAVIQQTKKEGARSAFLEVRESNLASRKLYESLGFAITGKRKSYYKDPEENALLMSKNI